MVYVELKAKYGNDWADHVKGTDDRHKDKDKSLTHMPTPEVTKLSFILFSNLTQTIADEWSLFSPYLPPEKIWEARIEEVKQIRNRVAHFRKGHRDDNQRIVQLLRDIDSGMFQFCTSLNQYLYKFSEDLSDPIIQAFEPLNPYIRREYTNHTFANRLEVRFDIISRHWSTKPKDFNGVIGKPGFFYDLRIQAITDKSFRYIDFLKNTKSLHPNVTLIALNDFGDNIRIILPSLLDKDELINTFDSFIYSAEYCLRLVNSEKDLSDEAFEERTNQVQAIADQWPEYIIGPRNPISFLEPEMECSFFNV
jgi:hypothetical protein